MKRIRWHLGVFLEYVGLRLQGEPVPIPTRWELYLAAYDRGLREQ